MRSSLGEAALTPDVGRPGAGCWPGRDGRLRMASPSMAPSVARWQPAADRRSTRSRPAKPAPSPRPRSTLSVRSAAAPPSDKPEEQAIRARHCLCSGVNPASNKTRDWSRFFEVPIGVTISAPRGGANGQSERGWGLGAGLAGRERLLRRSAAGCQGATEVAMDGEAIRRRPSPPGLYPAPTRPTSGVSAASNRAAQRSAGLAAQR